MQKLLLLLLGAFVLLQADDIIVFQNEYKVLPLEGKLKKVIIGNKEIINVSILDNSQKKVTLLKIFGKKSGNTSILMMFRNGTLRNYHVYVNQNLGFVQKMLNQVAPNIRLSRVGDGSIVLSGAFDNPHQKKKIYALLESAGIDLSHLMDITKTKKVNKMIRTKLYLVQINNNKAKELGGAVGLGFVNDKAAVGINNGSPTSVTFSGWLLNNAQQLSPNEGSSLLATLKFLQTKGVAKILDDTVLITTEDKNASFHVGGDVYIPIGITQTNGGYPTIQLEEKEYGLRLTLKTNFMEKDDFMHVNVQIRDSEFDPNKEHNVKLGGDSGAFSEGIEVPSFLSKHITTDIVARSKQVIALGGRLHKDEAEIEQRIPILSDIPLIGWLFRYTSKGYKSDDLLFFLVPEIVDANKEIDDSHFYRDFQKSADMFNETLLKKSNDKDAKKEVKKKQQPAMKKQTKIIIEVEKSAPQKQQKLEKPKKNLPKAALITPKQPEKKTKKSVKKVKPMQAQEEESEILLLETDENSSTPAQNIPENNSTIKTNDNNSSITPSLPKKEAAPTTVSKNQEEKKSLPIVTNEKKVYEIATKKIFIRTAPVNGRRVNVWKEGHRFIADAERTAGGIVWLRIVENCVNEQCTPLEKPLWVSKKYTKPIK